jgi:hypothetical protein
MAADRFGEPVTDGDIDRALAAALAVEPSAEFVARVRMRIADEPEPASWQFSWMIAAASCTIAVAIVITAMQMGHPVVPPSLPAKALGGLSFLPGVPGFPGSVTVAASAARRARREKATAEMRQVMQSNAALHAELTEHLRKRDYDAVAHDAALLAQNLDRTRPFWTENQADVALAMTASGLHALADLQAAALARDDAAIESAAAVVTGTCETCHKQYRGQAPDGTFEIRL